jgi:hypothetical protein
MKLSSGEPSAAPWRVVPVRDFVGLVLGSSAHNRPCILAVDGRGGNGKSTIADLVHHAIPNSLVVHTDDIAWHHSFFDWSDLLIEGILKPLHSGKAVRYQPSGWQTHGRTGAIEIAAGLALLLLKELVRAGLKRCYGSTARSGFSQTLMKPNAAASQGKGIPRKPGSSGTSG